MGTYYEARCGQCNRVLYGTTKGTFVREVTCPHCKARNLFSEAMAQHDGDIRGQVADVSSGKDRTSQGASALD